jgi:hypothetical protein
MEFFKAQFHAGDCAAEVQKCQHNIVEMEKEKVKSWTLVSLSITAKAGKGTREVHGGC